MPNKFNLNEEEYVKLVEVLYNEVKRIWVIYKDKKHRLWHSITIRIEGLKFEIEYNYDELDSTKFSDIDKHIIWKYNNLKLPDEAYSSQDRKIIRKYINENIYFSPDIETYSESIYKNPVKKILDYNKENKRQENEPIVHLLKTEEKIKNNYKEQKDTYKIHSRKRLRNIYLEEKIKTKTYVEQIEEQKNRVRSQILKHM